MLVALAIGVLAAAYPYAAHAQIIIRGDSTTPAGRLVAAGAAAERAGHLDEAQARYREAFRVADRDSVALANALYRYGIIDWARNRYDTALVYLGAAREVRRQLPDTLEYARVLNGIGASYYQLGIYEPALESFVQAMQLRRLTHYSVGLARTLTNIGKTYQDWGQISRARERLLEAAAVARHADHADAALGYVYNSLASLEIDAKRFDEALRYLGESRLAYARASALQRKVDSVDAWEINAAVEGQLLVQQQRAGAAIPVLDSVLISATNRASIRGRTLALLTLGEAHRQLGHLDEARRQLLDALRISRSAGQRVLSLQALDHLADIAESTREPTQALAYLRQYQILRDSVFDQDVALRIASREARAEADEARRDNAKLQLQQEVQAATITRQRIIVFLTLAVLAMVSTLIVLLIRASRREQARAADLGTANAHLERLNGELRTAVAEVRTLSGLIPICSNCKRVRDDHGYWQAVETWVTRHSDATFSHSICQSCGPLLYGHLWTVETGEASPTRTGAADADGSSQ